jgi:Leucine-rich repeat (LRR) protein
MINLNQITTKLVLFFTTLFLSVNVYSQSIFFPDPHLKTVLVANLLINTNGDGEIQKTEALAFSGSLDVSSSSIYDMSGMEYFKGLNSLNCSNNKIKILDLSSNINLVRLDCSNNKISMLNVGNCADLLSIDCKNNNLSDIDLSSNFLLNILSCQDNNLSDLDLVININLRQLDCSNNHISNLNVSNNTNLFALNCSNNQLSELNVSNNNNINIISSSFDATNNNLNCIQVDNAFYSTQNWSSQIDPSAYFSNNCIALSGQYVNAESIDELLAYPNPVGEVLTIELEKTHFNVTMEIYNTFGRLVMVQDFKELIRTDINLNLNTGVYMVTLRSDEGMEKSTRIIKS